MPLSLSLILICDGAIKDDLKIIIVFLSGVINEKSNRLCMGFLLFAPSALEAILSTASPQFFIRTFLGDVIAFAFGIYGGVVGVNFELSTVENDKGGRKMTTHYRLSN